MTPDIQQWLAEIRALQNQLTELRQEKDEAYTSAANWRRLYETEARQRRTEVDELQRAIADLKHNSLSHGQEGFLSNENSHPPLVKQLQADIQNLSVDQLQSLLAKALSDCHRLQIALDSERADHAKTRQSLMGALGDTVDVLTKERVHHQELKNSIQPHSLQATTSE